jgi:hypothetical protein
MKRMTFCTLFLLVLAQTLSDHFPCFSRDIAGATAPGSQDKGMLRIDNLYPTNGPFGSRRHTTFIAGEEMFFTAEISGIGVRANGECECHTVLNLRNSAGQGIVGQGNILQKSRLPLGTRSAIVCFQLKTEASTPKGRYTLFCQAVNNAGNQDETERRLEINILDGLSFGIWNARLCVGSEGRYGSGGNITQGQFIHANYKVNVPKNLGETTVSVIDQNGGIAYKRGPQRLSHEDAHEAGTVFCCDCVLGISEAGAYRIRIEAKDLSTNEIDKCDLPLVVHSPPGTSSLTGENTGKKPRDGVKSIGVSRVDGGTRPLTMDAYPTIGVLGPRKDTHYVGVEKMFFTVEFGGLSNNKNGEADCDLELSIRDSHSPTGANGKGWKTKMRAKDLPVSANHSAITSFVCRRAFEPGKYAVTLVAKDNIARRTASKDIAITIGPHDTFDLATLGISYDDDRKVWSGPNLTVGEPVYVGSEKHLPVKSAGNDVETTLVFLDANRKEIARMTPHREKNSPDEVSKPHGVTIVSCAEAFTPNRPGSYFLRIELKDLVTHQTVAKELPFNVFMSPELSEPKKTTKTVSSSVPTVQ